MKRFGYALACVPIVLALYVFGAWAWAPRETPWQPVELQRQPFVAGEATLLFAGDTAEIDAALPTLEKKGFEYPFSLTVDLLRDADLAVANLEAPITDGGDRIGVYTHYVYRAPSKSAAALAWAGFDLVTMANNHVVDYGASGIADSAKHLRAAGVEVVGAGKGDGEARRGAIVTIGDLRVGIVAYCEDQLFFHVWMNLFAKRGHAGAAMLSERNLSDDVARLRPKVDVLIVALHAGYNYTPPRGATRSWAERAIDLGADAVVVHHPHIAHPVALYKGRPILLSIGNFAFGTPGHPMLDYGWLALFHAADKRLDRVELVPLEVQNARVEFRPRPLDGDERDRAISKLIEASQPFGARLHEARGRAILELGHGS
jgi:poly-gamma-glutamate capsule biosynthesis protein CapA/YwtB (metallophosphatase superfamily)